MSSIISVERKQFYKSLFIIVAPIAVQNLLSSLVNSLDVFMLGFVGQTAIASVYLANQVQFILNLFYIGLASGLTMLTSQYWGRKDIKSLQILTGTALRISCSAGFIFFIATAFFSKPIMHVFTNDISLIENGSLYLRTVSLSYFFMAISQVYQGMLKSVEHVKTAMTTTVIALALNMVLNATFIFGWFGLPKLGIKGIALATVIARGVEVVICICAGLRIKDVKITPSCLFMHSKILASDFFKYSLPALGNEFVWGAAFATYSVILGHLGEDIVAANSVVNVARNLASVVCFGMAYGGAILLGKQMGEGNLEKAKRNANRLVVSTIVAGVICGGIMLCLRPILPFVSELTETAEYFRNILLYINSYSLIGATVNTVIICGVFRAGGDSKFGFFIDSISMWCVSIPLGCIAAFVLKLPPLWVYFVLFLDEFEKMPFVIIHFLKGKWLKNITREVAD
ncbi:MATE family efflux transporter [Treponema zioleckii]|uniref:MATE family efflux transporter n=1 Tax=Treponema zioleckii TaxID=331680 RepID=UPI00168B5825|nr:MATE family efflux transporter [Treponema zioleckii]